MTQAAAVIFATQYLRLRVVQGHDQIEIGLVAP